MFAKLGNGHADPAASTERRSAKVKSVAVRALIAAAPFAVLCGHTGLATAQGIAPVAQTPAQAAAPAQATPAKASVAKKAKPSQPAAGEEAKKADPAAAERQLEAGIKSYQAGKHEAAVQSFNGALQGGGLPSSRMARALYYRGLAYKAQGKPAQSISDLTSAIWLKGGLDEKERADALAQRSSAYREAGLGEPPALDSGPKPARTAANTVPPAAQPAAGSATTASSTGSGGGISGFFGNLFGGSSSSPATASPPAAAAAPVAQLAPATTGSIPPAPAVPKAEVSSWTGDAKSSAVGVAPAAKAAAAAAAPVPSPPAQPVRVASAQAPAARQAAAAIAPPQSPVAAAPAAASAASGKFRLQVAAVRTRQEADAIAAKLKKDLGKKLASREPVIDEAAIGNMGTFYRVRIGPYADANEPRRLCVGLRSSGGYDCLVVTQ